jgi:hypothetical protein
MTDLKLNPCSFFAPSINQKSVADTSNYQSLKLFILMEGAKKARDYLPGLFTRF